MTWEECESALIQELHLLEWERLEQDFEADWDEANWTLHHEKIHELHVAVAFAGRLGSGVWSSDLPMIVRWLVALRLRAILNHLAAFEAWGSREPASVEELLEKLAVRGWPLLRYAAHCAAALPSLVASVDDPWDEAAPPTWMQ